MRRSSRLSTKIKQTRESESLKNSKSSQYNRVEEENKKSVNSLCGGCNFESPPVKRFKGEPWIQCDICEKWWHLECACLDPDSADKIVKHKIYFPCATCVLRNSPWINCNPNKDTVIKHPNIPQSKNSIQQKELSDTLEESLNPDKILVIDNISESKLLTSSKEIKEKIKDKNIKGVDFAYKLPKGGVVLQFESQDCKKQAENNWPSAVFSGNESVHRPTGKTGNKVGYIRNIDPRFSENSISSFLQKKGLGKVLVKRNFHRNTGKPMPIARVTFETVDLLQRAVTTDLSLVFNGKETFVERERPKKVVRCYNCMLYGHIQKNCRSESRCERCGGTHTIKNCSEEIRCCNCGGGHLASSSNCPVYQEIYTKVVINQLM